MQSNFDRSLSAVLKHEGGFVNHPKDPGGATNKGITIATFRKWVKRDGTVADLKAITAEQVATIYRKHYWNAVKGDDLPGGIDYAVFDFAVNSGPTRAAKYLQTTLGVKADGIIGPVTLAAAKKARPSAVINKLCDNRMVFLKSLKTWDTFKNGWTARVDGVRSLALALAQPPVQPRQAPPAPTIAPTPQTPAGGAPIEPHEEDIAPPPNKRKFPWWIVGLLILIASVAGLGIDWSAINV